MILRKLWLKRTAMAGRMGIPLATAALLAVLLAACGGQAAATPTPTTASEAVSAVPTPTLQISDIAAVGPTPTATPVGVRPVSGGIWNGRGNVGVGVDPHYVLGGQSGYVFFNGLIQQKFPFDASKGVEFEPYLATEYSTSEDGTKWRLKLRQGVVFHDGEAFNADDVVATVQRFLDPQFLVPPLVVPMRKVFKSARKVDDYTVELDTGEPNTAAFAFITDWYFVILPEHLIRGEDPASTEVAKRWRILHPDKSVRPNNTGTLSVGTGPWKMTKWEADKVLDAERNPNYFKFDQHGNRLPYIDKLHYLFVQDPTRALARFVAGETEFTLGTSAGMHPNQAKAICSQTKAQGCYILPMPHGYFGIILNPQSTAPFKDPKVVQAARYSNNMDEIFRIAYGGRQGYMWMDRGRYPETALPQKEQYELLPWSNPSRRPEFEQKSQDLMAEAGYPKGLDLPYPIFATHSGGGPLCTGSFLDEYSRHVDAFYRVGIRGILECRQGVITADELKAGRWSINGPGTPHVLDPGAGLILWALLDSPAVGGSPWRWEGQLEVDAKYREAVKILDQAKQNERYKDIERYLANPNFTNFPAGYSTVYYAAHSCVHDYVLGGLWWTWVYAMERAWLEPNSKCRE